MSGFREENESEFSTITENVAQVYYTVVCSPRCALSQTDRWPYLGILLRQEVGGGGLDGFRLMSVPLSHMRKGGEAICSDVPHEDQSENTAFQSLHSSFIATRGHYIIRDTKGDDDVYLEEKVLYSLTWGSDGPLGLLH